MMTTHEQRACYTVEETGQILGIGRNSAYEAVRRGDIPALRIGRRLVVPRLALEQMLTSAGKLEITGDLR